MNRFPPPSSPTIPITDRRYPIISPRESNHPRPRPRPRPPRAVPPLLPLVSNESWIYNESRWIYATVFSTERLKRWESTWPPSLPRIGRWKRGAKRRGGREREGGAVGANVDSNPSGGEPSTERFISTRPPPLQHPPIPPPLHVLPEFQPGELNSAARRLAIFYVPIHLPSLLRCVYPFHYFLNDRLDSSSSTIKGTRKFWEEILRRRLRIFQILGFR